MDKADECERSHKKLGERNYKIDKTKNITKEPLNESINNPKYKYIVTVKDKNSSKESNNKIEEYNIDNVAKDVKNRFPNHYGFTIKQVT